MCLVSTPKIEPVPTPPTTVKPDVSNLTAAVREQVAKKGLQSQMLTAQGATQPASVLKPTAGGLAPSLSSKTGGGA